LSCCPRCFSSCEDRRRDKERESWKHPGRRPDQQIDVAPGFNAARRTTTSVHPLTLFRSQRTNRNRENQRGRKPNKTLSVYPRNDVCDKNHCSLCSHQLRPRDESPAAGIRDPDAPVVHGERRRSENLPRTFSRHQGKEVLRSRLQERGRPQVCDGRRNESPRNLRWQEGPELTLDDLARSTRNRRLGVRRMGGAKRYPSYQE
jgi:hypothetical protein